MTEYILPLIITFILSVICGRLILPLLIKLKAGQTEREDGPASHKVKNGTPTMGGFIFLIPWIIVTAFYIPTHRNVVPILIAGVGFAAVGFADDYLKVVKKRNLGLRAWQKLLLQVLVSAAVLTYISLFTNASFDIRIPYGSFFTVGGAALMISLGVFAIPAQIVIMCGTVNGSNFTDGLDGLAASVTAVIALFMAIASSVTSAGIAPAAMSFLGGLLGFLVYNHHPAKVFMGDTGSLSLGGFVAAGFIMMNMPLYLIIAAFIYFAEVLSVIIQVLYFKSTGGKRFFRMAPIHHHFELSGWSEVKVVTVFSIVTVMLCALALTAI
ncbi:MAG: phospho-N-acetylmuramoyl-pentapeptide-transferase [Lachnospiraceae bacterium]|nr:phospho-N-acetylmuramoyl-pentapeptide-transferase [Lachnospiraceae bacterium]